MLAIAVCSCIAGTATADAKTRPSSTTTTTKPDPCVGSLRTPAEYQNAFDSLVGLGTGWSTADGYVPVALPDARTAWLMSDTLLAPPSVNGASAPAFVHNSVVVQRGVCFTPVLDGALQQRDDLIPPVGVTACWQSAGVAVKHVLYAFCTDVESADGPPGFGFRVTGTSIATLALPDLTLIGRTPLPFAEPAGIRWGTGATRVGRFTYVYGHATGSQHVARVPTDHSPPARGTSGAAPPGDRVQRSRRCYSAAARR